MSNNTDIALLKMPKIKRFGIKLGRAFASIPGKLKNLGLKIVSGVTKVFNAIATEISDIVTTFKSGSWKTKLSYLVMGFGSFTRGQVLRGVLFALFEVVFICYMVFAGAGWLAKLPTLGTLGPTEGWVYVEEYGMEVWQTIYRDNSFKILLYSVLTIFFIVAFIYTWRLNVKQQKAIEEILATGKPIRSGKEDAQSLLDDQFHKTLLALPLVGIAVFTVMPIFFMILVAFTNYSGAQNGLQKLFTWVGWENFNTMFNWQSGNKAYAAAFGEILTWTLIWAFFATFTNYFLGMMVAIMINKKGIKLKKVWRTILVLTIAIPQFISLLYISKLFSDNGLILTWLRNAHLVSDKFSFIGTNAKPWTARITVIVINIWIGIPYLMLIVTGILMNIPEDLYESARIDGANIWQTYTKITLPYMLFVTGPYLLTSFTGNMNNFNVIYLLTGGGPTNVGASAADGSVGYTDLLITWLFKITQSGDSKYYMASVVGILVFVVVAFVSLVVYNIIPSTKNEEDFQ